MSDSDADLFAIPDFWKRSSWYQQPPPLAAEERKDGFFRLEINGDEPVTFFLGKDEYDPPRTDDSNGGGLFKIPDLLKQLQPSPPGTTHDGHDPSPTVEHLPDDLDPVDFWLFPDRLDPPALPEFKTWAAFESADIPTPAPLFATEQGPRFLDALVAADENPLGLASRSPTTRDADDGLGLGIIDTRKYCACLLALALGRSSVLFAWSDDKRSFLPLLQSARISGFTAEVLRSVERDCLECGNNNRFLRAFVDHAYTAAASASTPSRVALARGIDGLLLTIQSELGARGQRAQSLLQLQALVQPVASLAKFIRGLVAKLARPLETAASDEKFLTMLFQEAQSMEYSVVFMRDIIKQLLQLVSEPWLGFVSEWIGLDPRSKSALWTGEFQSKGFVRLDDRVWIDDMGVELAEPDYFLDEDKMPAFIPEEMAKDIFETGRNLRFLWTNHPDHPLSNSATVALARPPALQWHFDWDSIHALDRKALAYERDLLQSFAFAYAQPMPPFSAGSPGSLPPNHPIGSDTGISWRLPAIEFEFFGKSQDEIGRVLQTSMAMLAGPLPRPAENGGLAATLRRQLFNDGSGRDGDAADMAAALGEFAPHWSLLPLLSFGPVISAQARLVNRECMKLLFGVHGIREHLQLQKQFQLLGNGMFCSRLSHALFDPDLAGAEQGTGVELSSGGLGLRLSRRNGENWPPASSELRLALMGILAESYYQGRPGSSVGGFVDESKRELPGGMSFAVRDLSPEEMDKCMDPDSLEALDFLRLSYKPPSALMSVITPAILSKYDRVFQLLLRVLRMYYVVNQLVYEGSGGAAGTHGHRDRHRRASPDNVSTRFRIEGRHFVANIMAYFLDTGVGMPWQKFEAWLTGVQKSLEEEVAPRLPSPSSRADQASPEKLRERHDQVLDEMMLALLLRKRQQPLLLLLQGIFGLILDFAKSSRKQARASAAAAAAERFEEAEAARQAHNEEAKRMYASFRKKVAAFLAVCRGLSEKEADSVARKDYQQQQQYQDGSRAGEGNSLSKLLLMLDYNGTYSSRRQ